MNINEAAELAEPKADLISSGGFFDEPTSRERLIALEAKMSISEFWNDNNAAKKVISEVNILKGKLEPFAAIEKRIEELPLVYEMAEEDGSPAALDEARSEQASIIADLDKLELKLLLAEPNDRCNAICSLHAGAGGTESCDWANILFRMYQRWCERRGFAVEIADVQAGDSAGIKTATFIVRGEFAFGNLKCERGVHRLVRISPFDSNARRHTSFVALDVLAEVDDDIDIVVDEKDVRVDVYRSGGPGGQGVNTTDSAVRVTHMPSGLVVTCQNERSQIKNRATAMKILKSRLYDMEMDKKRAEMDKYYGEKGQIGFGRQIRSYVLQPYQMVKDLRTGEQTSNTQGVLDGDIDTFIEAKLRGKKRTDTDDDID